MANCLNISVVVFSTLGIGFLILSLATDYWRSFSFGKIKTHHGLFRGCTTWTSTTCRKLYSEVSDYPEKLAAVVAMMLMAVLFQGISMITAVAATIRKSSSNVCIAILQLLAAGSGAAGLAIYAKYYDNDFYDLDWSYVLGWVGTSFVGIGLILLIAIMNR